MARKIVRRSRKKAGLPPGTLIHVGEVKQDKPRLRIIDYDKNDVKECDLKHIDECLTFMEKPTVTWINIDGLHEVELIEKIGGHFTLHPLMLEDIVNTNQRPKYEEYDDSLFVVIKMLRFDEEKGQVNSEQISFVLSDGVVISFQEVVGDIFDPIRKRIQNAKSRLRTMKADYLLYALLDCIVDHYFSVLEKIGEKIETLQDEIEINANQKTLQEIHDLKREMIFVRKAIWPVRELVSALSRTESELVSEKTGVFLTDLYDHIVQVVDTTETYREMISGLLDIYLSMISNKMNEVMKVLTLIATMFIPLTFLAGIYGMNFDHIPELHWRYSYPAFWVISIALVIGMIYWFKRKKWL